MDVRPATTNDEAPASVVSRLRELTRHNHEAVDTAFGRFDLTDRDDYAAFLSAHARVLPGLERDLEPASLVPQWRGRTEALISDLEALCVARPPAERVDLPAGKGAIWGALYVIEGSRLGGVFLARRVGEGLPTAYLSAAHEQGGWKRILTALEAAADGPAWQDDAIAGAKAVFEAYEHAAGEASQNG